MNHSSDHVEYTSPAIPQSFMSRHPSNAFPDHPIRSPALNHGPSEHAMAFGSPQIESSIGPTRVLTRRRTRATVQGQVQGQIQGQGQSDMSNHAAGEAIDRPQHSLAFTARHLSRPHTPSVIGQPEPLSRIRDGTHSMAPASQFSLPVTSASPTFSPYPYIHAHSRSTSGSNTSNPRSASPALSVASALTSVSSSNSAPNSRNYSNMHQPLPPKKHTKTRLTGPDRRAICIYARDHPDIKQEDIAAHFGVERSTVSKILKFKARWLNVPESEISHAAKFRPSKFPYLEAQLAKWLEECNAKNTILTDALIRAKAREIGDGMHLTEDKFKASSGWVENFKNRHGIKKGVWHGYGKTGDNARSPEAEYIPEHDHASGSRDEGEAEAESEEDSQEMAPPLTLRPVWHPDGSVREPDVGLPQPEVQISQTIHMVPVMPAEADPSDQQDIPYIAPNPPETVREHGTVTIEEAETAVDILLNYINQGRLNRVPDNVLRSVYELKSILFVDVTLPA
ncbi:Tigger transposable element-derived protein 6 [Grifola frondosa]|uniref:Tigger transposable element-derived protein 6 n=1 Tax=Grifola frondosa TaxID=5627 RepID=A0A1C7LY61_GRIFR|nr:Tigger transposable element-derived protein 6 [Grifola frondosa]